MEPKIKNAKAQHTYWVLWLAEIRLFNDYSTQRKVALERNKEIVPPESAQELHDKYKELGLHVQLEWVPDEGHGFYEGKDFAIFRATEFFISRLAE